MKSDREIFLNVPESASAEELDAYLSRACGGDAALRRRVEAMLAAAGSEKDFMNTVKQDWPTRPDEEPSGESPGTVIGNYKLLERIGEGGFGVVYMAQQIEPVKRRVALKIIKLGMDTKQVVARFEAERRDSLQLGIHAHLPRSRLLRQPGPSAAPAIR